MGGRRPARAVRTHHLWWWLGGAGAVALVSAVAVGVFVWGAPVPSGPASPGLSASPAATSASAPLPVSATPTPSVSPTPSATPTPTPTPSPTRAVQKVAYCKAFRQITTGPVSTGSGDEALDYDALADRFTVLITVYSSAAKAAPSSLDRQYAAVLAYLTDMREAVVTKDLDGIKAMIANLELLNEAMAAIQEKSEEICG